MRDDYDDRIRESNEAIARRRQAYEAEIEADARRDEFYDKLSDGDQDGLRWMFGMGPWNPAGAADGGDDAGSTRAPSLQERFRRHVSDFQEAVEGSGYIPRDVAARWVDTAHSVDLNSYVAGLEALEEVALELVALRQDTKPAQDVFSMSPSKEMHHMRSFDAIEHELGDMWKALEHLGRFAEGSS